MKIYPELEIDIDVEVLSPGRAGRYYGPPENCYPDEPAEITWDVSDDEIVAAFRRWVALHWEQIERQAMEEYDALRGGGG